MVTSDVVPNTETGNIMTFIGGWAIDHSMQTLNFFYENLAPKPEGI
jgi:hypothetical protein